MNPTAKIHWGRVLIGGFLAEAAVIAIVFPVSLLFGERAFLTAIPLASFAMIFLFAVWVGRKIESHFVVHGMLVGLVATLLYVAITLGRPEPLLYVFSHGLKILGGAAGGRLAEKRRTAAMA